jgi:hypothetical protein
VFGFFLQFAPRVALKVGLQVELPHLRFKWILAKGAFSNVKIKSQRELASVEACLKPSGAKT